MNKNSGNTRLSGDWYTTSISNNILNRMWHAVRYQELSKVIETTRGRVLDIGSADGTFTKIIFDKTKAGKLIGIDILGHSLSYAKRRFARSRKINFRQAAAEDIPYADSQFDAVFCLETLLHSQNPESVISEIQRVLSPGGYVVFMNTTTNSLIRRLLTPFTKLSHPKKLSDKQIKHYLEKYQLEIVDVRKLLGGLITTFKARKR